jgi:hypothetical protein
MAKVLALAAYGILLAISSWFMIASLSANQTLPFSWRPDNIAFTFVLMVVFLISALVSQAVRPFSLMLLVQVLVTGVLLLAASLLHAFPAWSIPLGALHLVCAIGFTFLNVFSFFGRVGVT